MESDATLKRAAWISTRGNEQLDHVGTASMHRADKWGMGYGGGFVLWAWARQLLQGEVPVLHIVESQYKLQALD